MEKVVADANVFLRFLLNDVPEQANETAELLKRAKSGKIRIHVPQIVIFEIFFALDKFYKFPKQQIVDKVGTILSSPFLEVQNTEIFQTALLFYNEKNLDFVDCFLLCFCKDSGMKLFTFDKNLQKQESTF